MNDFRTEPAELREGMVAAARGVIESGWYILGREVESFEKRWAVACGVQHAIGLGNGMDAIEIALRALGIGHGDEVITSPMTAFASVLGIVRAGATPVLADIESGTGLLDIDSVARCVTARTRAVLLVHLYGQVRQMDKWLAFCKDHGLELIEDCAQAHIASWGTRVAGSFGRAGAYSFYPTKNLGAIGDAGILVTNDGDLARLASQLRNYGQSVRYHHPILGMNSRLDEMQAALLSARMAWLQEFTARRRKIAMRYRVGIRNPLVTLMDSPEEEMAHVYHLFVVLSEQRDALQAHLQSEGVQTLIHYPIPIHQQEPCLETACDPLGLGRSERHAARCLSLPCHPQMTDAETEQVVAAINCFAG